MISTNLYLFFTFQAEERTDAHIEGEKQKQKCECLESQLVNSVIR